MNYHYTQFFFKNVIYNTHTHTRMPIVSASSVSYFASNQIE